MVATLYSKGGKSRGVKLSENTRYSKSQAEQKQGQHESFSKAHAG
jgi:hypothetical protein